MYFAWIWDKIITINMVYIIEPSTRVVAFNAKIAGFSGLDTGFTRIPFNIVDLNTGGSYDPEIGIFKAPISGLYSISYEILASPSCRDNHVCVNLLVNGVFSSGSCSKVFSSGGTAVNLKLMKGTSVWLVTSYSATCHTLHPDSQYNTFSAHLVHTII